MSHQNENPIALWLALFLAPNISWQQLHELFDLGITVQNLFCGQTEALSQLGLQDSTLNYLQAPNWKLVEQHLKWAEEKNHHVITIQDTLYPQILKEIHDPPLLLFVWGNPSALNQPQIAIVGSRKPTPSGCETAYYFAQELASNEVAIISGLAYGIDVCAHRGALSFKSAQKTTGTTIAVLGSGINIIYPRRHQQIAEQIIENGALISEFPLGTPPLRENFPQRNRVVTGMSLGTIVVEATLKSGSLISARCAMEQNREVFAVPGSIHSPQSEGCHLLIRNGATLLTGLNDLYQEITTLNKTSPVNKINPDCKIELDEGDKNLLECVGFEVTQMDTIITRAQLPLSEISTKLLNFELLGLIYNVSGGYIRVNT